MKEIGTVIHHDRLRRRRHDVDLTLRHLESERRQVIANTRFMDPNACTSRLRLLEHLTRWYRKELGNIDNAMGGRQLQHGRCVGCLEPIEADRLESRPDVDLCWDCVEYMETRRGCKHRASR